MSERMGSTGNVASGVFYTAGGGFIIAMMTVLTVPAYLSVIGQERYGVLVAFWTVVTTLSLLDLGVSGATTQRIARSAERAEERDQIFWTSISMNAAMGIVGALLVMVLITPIAMRLSFSSHAARAEFVACWPAMAAVFLITLIRSIVQASMVAMGRFKVLAVICTVEGVAVALVPLVIAHTLTVYVPFLLLSVVVLKGLTLIFMAVAYLSATPKFSVRAPQAAIAKSLFSFGLWATVSSTISPLLVTLDRFLIGNLVGVGKIPAYSLPQSITQHLSIIPRAFANVLFPKFSTVLDPGDASALGVRAIEATNFLMVPVYVAALIVVEPFLYLWVGADFAHQSKVVALIFIAEGWVSGLGRIPYALLYGRGRPDQVAQIHLAEIVPFIVTLYVAIKYFGIAGAASVVLLRTAADTLLLARCCGLRSQLLRLCALPAVLICAPIVLGLSLPIDSVVRWVLAIGWGAATVTWFVLGAPNEIATQIIRYMPFLKAVPFGRLARST